MTTMEEPLLKLTGAPHEGQFAVKAVMIRLLLESRPKEAQPELRYVRQHECLRHERSTFPEVARTTASRGALDNSRD